MTTSSPGPWSPPARPAPKPPTPVPPPEPHPLPAAARFLALDTPELALSVIRELFDDDPAVRVLLLIEDRVAEQGIAVPVQGPVAEHTMLERLLTIAVGANDDARPRRVLLGCRRPGAVGSVALAEEDLRRWRSLRAAVAGTPLTLVEWFAVYDDGAHAIGELAGAPPDWV